MSDSIAGLRRKISSASDLQSVVRTMKTLAASSIGQYEKSLLGLADYYRTVELGLAACFRELEPVSSPPVTRRTELSTVNAIVFGSDQGLVGQFNEAVAEYALKMLATLPGQPQVWAVGERVHAYLAAAGLPLMGLFTVPTAIKAVTQLVGQLQIEGEAYWTAREDTPVYVFYNSSQVGAVFAPVHQRLLPLDSQWQQELAAVPWPTRFLPEVISTGASTLSALIREYLFISLFRACVESLRSENASRLAAMERADNNIDELLEVLQGSFHRLRQSSIDAELFDVVAGMSGMTT